MQIALDAKSIWHSGHAWRAMHGVIDVPRGTSWWLRGALRQWSSMHKLQERRKPQNRRQNRNNRRPTEPRSHAWSKVGQFALRPPLTGAGYIQQRLESKHDGALEHHWVEMDDDTRQQHP